MNLLTSIIFAVILLVTEVSSQSQLDLNEQRPNIIFIMSDDHAQKAISAYSNELIQTPNIDRIANEGMIFKNSYVTNSICAPSRATMLTGKYSCENGLRDNRDEFDGSQQTFPKLLREKGYQTSIVGKWHLKSKPTGFDNWKVLLGQGEYYNPRLWENGDTIKHIGYTTDLITDLAIDQLEERDKDQPFAMLVHHKAPHRNWMPNFKYLGAFDSLDIPIPKTFYDNYSTREPASKSDMRIDDMYISFDMKLKKGSYEFETGSGGKHNSQKNAVNNWDIVYNLFTEDQKELWDKYYDEMNEEFKLKNLTGDDLLEWKYKRYMQDYLACILSVDESVGRILDYLDENNLSKNTIVVYTSDQGFYLGEHGWYDKRWMYEESFRTPLLIRYPKVVKPNSSSNDFVMNLDYASTFLDYAGVSIPSDIQGESFRNILEGETPLNWRKTVYYHYYEFPHGWHNVSKHNGIRTNRYKLIHFYRTDNWELFDLQNDPNELRNIYDEMKDTDAVAELKLELTALKNKYNDTEE